MIRNGLRGRVSVRALVIMASAMLFASACAPVETAVVAAPGQAFALPLGQTAAVRGTEVRLTFKDVRTDSRCPVEVQCVWAGEAKIGVVISNGTPEETRVLSLTPPDNEATVGNLRIRFVGLAPVPRQADPGTNRAYVAQLVVDRP